eukprot:1192995-Prorocentrum_minimum.AAC.3
MDVEGGGGAGPSDNSSRYFGDFTARDLFAYVEDLKIDSRISLMEGLGIGLPSVDGRAPIGCVPPRGGGGRFVRFRGDYYEVEHLVLRVRAGAVDCGVYGYGYGYGIRVGQMSGTRQSEKAGNAPRTSGDVGRIREQRRDETRVAE